ncbi:MAG: M20/M25/M40 family metallo-hydrolase [Balneola sp.]|nr:MAG: M20/M25/M40 family metallo-hydrolase [Balneola sp.]
MKVGTGIFRKAGFVTVFALISILQRCGIQEYTPNEKSVSQILKTLSSDQMKGRQALSPEIWEAASYISSKFNKAGLTSLQENEDYLQTFNLIEIGIATSSFTINNREIPSDHYFAFLNGSNVNWQNGEVEVAEIKEEENFRQAFREFRETERDLLVFVDPSASNIFNRFQNFFSRPQRVFEGESNPNIVFVIGTISDNYEVNITPEITSHELANVTGVIEGKRKDEFVLFSAHYDHIGVRPAVQGDSIANGANDNASGVTAVIELAKHFKSLGKPERTLIFTTFTAEEMGGFGSRYFSEQLDPDQIVAMFNIEMIGKPAVSGPNTAWITGYDRSDFGELLSKSTEGTDYEFYPDPYPQQNLFFRSDNATLARLGVPAHTISTTPIDVDKDYHAVTDEYETINVSHLTNTIKAIAKAARGIVSGEDTPTRVDVSLID